MSNVTKKMIYVAGFLQATLDSPHEYSKEELTRRLRYILAVIQDEPEPEQHLQSKSSETTRAASGEVIH